MTVRIGLKLPHFHLVQILLGLSISASGTSQDSLPHHSSAHQEQAELFEERTPPVERTHVSTGLENLLANHPHRLAGKRLGIVTNHTGVNRDGTPIWELIAAVPGAM